MKNYFLFFILGSLFLSFSCTKEKTTIGFMLPNMLNKRYEVERDLFTKKINEAGGEILFYSADNDALLQEKQLDEMLQKGVNLVVLDPVNRFTAAGMVRKLHDKGIKVISYDRLIANCQPDLFVSFDAHVIGEQMANYAITKRPYGNYVILSGDKSDINAVWMNEGFHKVIDPYVKSGKIKLSYEAYMENWSEDDAYNIMKKYINYSISIPDVILSANDNISKGCINIITQKGYSPEDVIITGQGAEPMACKFMLQNKQSISVYKSVKKMATLVAELSIKVAQGEDIAKTTSSNINNGKFDIPVIFLETQVVDASNIRSVVVADGMITEKDLEY